MTNFFSDFFNKLRELFTRNRPWHELSVPLGITRLFRIRDKLRKDNLHDTSKIASTDNPDLGSILPHHRTSRMVDGTYNDLKHPEMGRVGARFGRNVPLDSAYPEEGEVLLTPNPRKVSLELLTRHEFIPATTLNLLAASWIQFMVHDWFSHGKNAKNDSFEIPLEDDDPWPERPMTVRRTRKDPTRPQGSAGPPTYLNKETHWWDGSQIYGSDNETMMKVRSGSEGKLKLGGDGLLPVDPETGIDISGVTGNWWIGLSMLHTLFTLEHNAICDRLRAEFSSWSDDELFARARLINAAIMAKIHTIEWTPGIIPHPTVKFALNGNWTTIRHSKADHHGAPYAMTEEFVSVYRMHPLMPDDFTFRSTANNETLEQRTLPEVSGRHARDIMKEISLTDLFYSFGVSHPGAITLHNYPRFLQKLERPDGPLIDLAAVDVLRDRERGVPRYNEFRRAIDMPPAKSFEELTDNKPWAEELRRVYNNDIDRVDLMVGMYAERLPEGFGFSETAFRIFILMATRRLQSDRFFTDDYNAKTYTQTGLDWIEEANMRTVLMRHLPGLKPLLRDLENAFAPWPQASA
ncbi:MAG: peroxidase [Blastocatellia bacterium]|nr:peroxidase [Blastocatellia bacterium]